MSLELLHSPFQSVCDCTTGTAGILRKNAAEIDAGYMASQQTGLAFIQLLLKEFKI